MAGDWIKMRTDLAIDHRVILMAESLRSSPDFQAWCCGQSCDRGVTQRAAIYVVVAALLKVWGMARTQGKIVGDDSSDVLITPSSLLAIDVVSDLPGFGAAMESVRWAKVEAGPSVRLPDCVRHIYSQDEVKRMKDAKRQQLHRRDKACDVSQGVSQDCHTKVAPTITTNHTGHNGIKRHHHSTISARSNGDGVKKMNWGKSRNEQDLFDDSKLDELFGAVVANGFAYDSDEDRVRFVALVLNIRRGRKAKNRFGILTRSLEGQVKSNYPSGSKDWRSRPEDADRDAARALLKSLDGIAPARHVSKSTEESEAREHSRERERQAAEMAKLYPKDGKAAS